MLGRMLMKCWDEMLDRKCRTWVNSNDNGAKPSHLLICLLPKKLLIIGVRSNITGNAEANLTKNQCSSLALVQFLYREKEL